MGAPKIGGEVRLRQFCFRAERPSAETADTSGKHSQTRRSIQARRQSRAPEAVLPVLLRGSRNRATRKPSTKTMAEMSFGALHGRDRAILSPTVSFGRPAPAS